MKRLTFAVLFGLMSILISAVTFASHFQPQNMQQVGEKATLNYMFWDVYHISLYAPEGEFDPKGYFSLSIDYLREIDGELIAGQSIKEMRKQGMEDEARLEQWFTRIVEIFPDVDATTRLTGIRDTHGYSHFLHNGKPIGSIRDPLFSEWFFNIWLSEKSSYPQLRKQILGEKQ